jgi:hypothetical protein
MLLTILTIAAVALNIIIVIWKFKHSRLADAIVDSILLVLVAMVFSVSTQALIIGAFGSLIVSIYLLFSPVVFLNTKEAI